MIRAGDELSHTQRGNNNAYCQDNEISWLSWDLDDHQVRFLEFVRRLVELRKRQPVLRRSRFFQGRPLRGSAIKDIVWLKPSGREMTDADWSQGHVRTLGVLLSGEAIDEVDGEGERIVGDTLLLVFNAHPSTVAFRLPPRHDGAHWERVLDTADPEDLETEHLSRGRYEVIGRSVVVFRLAANIPRQRLRRHPVQAAP
jgi:glycogen operon protein